MASPTVSLAFARRTKDTVDVATPPYELLCCVDAGAHPALTQMEDSVATAMATYRDALASFREQLGDDHAHTLTTIGSLASLRHASGDEAGAKALMREALEGRRRTLGAEHPHTMVSLWSLAKLERSVPLLEEAHAGFCAALGVSCALFHRCRTIRLHFLTGFCVASRSTRTRSSARSSWRLCRRNSPQRSRWMSCSRRCRPETSRCPSSSRRRRKA